MIAILVNTLSMGIEYHEQVRMSSAEARFRAVKAAKDLWRTGGS